MRTFITAGTEYRALFVSTHEKMLSDGRTSNPTKSICDPFVFNTAITRAQSLVISFGNPFMLLKIEDHMEKKYSSKVNCWHEYLRRCIECKTFIVPYTHRSDDLQSEKQLQSMLFTDTVVCPGIKQLPHDSILSAYAKVFEKIPECRQAQLVITRINRNVTWTISSDESKSVVVDNHSVQQTEFSAVYECLLSCLKYDRADAIPLDPHKHVVKILGANNRRGAFDGDTVMVGIFDDSASEQRGRVIRCTRRHSALLSFACHVDATNPILFVPLNNKDPKLLNLPKLSQDLLKKKTQLGLDKEIKSNEVVVFKDTWDGQGLPQIRDVIPLCIAQKMLFVVRFLCWNPKFRLPLGIVVAAIPQGLSLFHAQRLLQLQHNISGLEIGETFIPSDSVIKNISLMLNERAFTIDPEGAQNLDDAISLVHVRSTGTSHIYEMAVHIANVAKYIKLSSDEDKRARNAGTSVYGTRSGGCAHLLPSHLRSKLSLSPMKVRDVISVVSIVTFDNDNSQPKMSEPVIMESQIVSQLQLSYKTARDILLGTIPDDVSICIDAFNSTQRSQPSLTTCLDLLYQIAFEQRKRRLGDAAAYSYDISEEGDESCWQAHLLIDELMIWANHAIAKCTFKANPNCTLLRRQRQPNCEERSSCLELHKLILTHSLSLQELVVDPVTTIPIKVPQFMIERFLTAIRNNDASLLAYLLTADHYYPQLAICQSQLQSINHKAEYCCTSVDNDPMAIAHHSLHLDLYTHFTSPIRRYMDIQVQRMLISSLHASNSDVYSAKMCEDLCHHLNSCNQAAKSFENELKQVSLGLELTTQSVECYAFVKQLDRSSVDLSFPDLRFKLLYPRQRNIKLRNLAFIEKNINGQYMWNIKILSFEDEISIRGYQTPFTDEGTPEDKSCSLCKLEILQSVDDTNYKKHHLSTNLKPLVRNIEAGIWKELQTAACKVSVTPGCSQSLKHIRDMEQLLTSHEHSPDQEQGDAYRTLSPLVNYILLCNIDIYDLLKVWLSWEAKEGLIAPCIQMVQLSPDAHICIQHNNSPADCFSSSSLPQASKPHYNSISEYVSLWEPLILAEGAELSVKQGQIIIIQNVLLKWPELAIPQNCVDDLYYEPQGSIIIDFPHHFQETPAMFIGSIRIGDMICVRYGTISGSKAKAVFHMVVTELTKDNDIVTSIKTKIFGKQNCRISDEVKDMLHLKCEVQLIPMATSIQYVQILYYYNT